MMIEAVNQSTSRFLEKIREAMMDDMAHDQKKI